MGFAMESQELKELSFCIVYRKIKCQHFQKKNNNNNNNNNKKMQNTIFLQPLPELGQKLIFHKNWTLLFMQKIRKKQRANSRKNVTNR